MAVVFTLLVYDKTHRYSSHSFKGNLRNIKSCITDTINNYSEKGLNTEMVFITKGENKLPREILSDPLYEVISSSLLDSSL